MTVRRVAWTKDSVVGAEFAEVELLGDRLRATAIAIGDDPLPYRADYELETGPGFVTTRLSVRTRGDGWSRALDLRRLADGSWTSNTSVDGDAVLPDPGGDTAIVEGALDCDVAHSPVTNSMPVLRHRLLEQPGTYDLLMAWVSLPDLAFRPSRQRYVSAADVTDSRIVRYVSLDGSFTADLTFDLDGLVIDYPQLGRRLR
jgi:hypothetical protein